MESCEMNQTATDLLLQEAIQTNQKLEDVQKLLTSIQDMKNILPKSIENVLFVQLKNLQDSVNNWLKTNDNQLQKNQNQFNDQLYQSQKNLETQLGKIKNETTTAIADNCQNLYKKTETDISNIIKDSTKQLKVATKVASKMIGKNLLMSFAASIVLIAGSIGGLLYVQNYKDGTEIARAKAVEVLAEEREKIELEAVEDYKASDDYREDACKLVAENITKVDCLHYLYVYARSEDIKKYGQIKRFYDEVLKEANKQYKSYGK